MKGDKVYIDFGLASVGEKTISFEPLPDRLNAIIKKKGLVNWISEV